MKIARTAVISCVVMLLAMGGVAFGADTSGKKQQPPTSTKLGNQFMSLNLVEKGMRGIGKTVIRGTKIDTFDVEVMGVLTNASSGGDLILVRVSGPVIDETGGIAAGMSGSPVYINGRLVGALSMAFGYSDHRIGMVTPIESMLPILDMVAQNTRLTLRELVRIGGEEYREVVFAGNQAAPELAAEKGTLVMIPVSTPIMVSGLGSRALAFLSQRLSQYNFVPVASGGSAGFTNAVGSALEPGSAIGVQLARGDVEMTAVGTVTYVDGQRFIGFGHPMMNRGMSNFFATGVYVHTVIPSMETPFKLGTPLGVLGVVNQDRNWGIGGVMGKYPQVVPVHIRVYDEDLKQQTDQYIEVIRDDMLSLSIVASVALQAMDVGLNRIGPGTSAVAMEIQGEGLPKGGFKRENVFYSDTDISAASLGEFMEAMDIALNNEFKNVNISQVSLNISVKEARETARIEKITPAKTEVHPGEAVEVTVLLRPYRKEPIVQKVKLSIPMDVPTGTVTVTVRGGSDFGYAEEVPSAPGHQAPAKEKKDENKDKAKEEEKPKTNYESFGNLVDAFTHMDGNNMIVVEFIPALDEEGDGQSSDAGLTEIPPIKSTAVTNYVVEGFQNFDLNIVPWPETNKNIQKK